MTRKVVDTVIGDGGKLAAGFFKENNDCAVRAIAFATGVSYSKAHDLFTAAGRKHGKGSSLEMIDRVAANFMSARTNLGRYHTTPTGQRRLGWCPTLATFLKEHPTGKYVVIIRRHAVAIINGKCYDSFVNSGSKPVSAFYKVA